MEWVIPLRLLRLKETYAPKSLFPETFIDPRPPCNSSSSKKVSPTQSPLLLNQYISQQTMFPPFKKGFPQVCPTLADIHSVCRYVIQGEDTVGAGAEGMIIVDQLYTSALLTSYIVLQNRHPMLHHCCLLQHTMYKHDSKTHSHKFPLCFLSPYKALPPVNLKTYLHILRVTLYQTSVQRGMHCVFQSYVTHILHKYMRSNITKLIMAGCHSGTAYHHITHHIFIFWE